MTNRQSHMKRIVIVGAGPCGLLMAALLLHRNEQKQEQGGHLYHVTLVDDGEDLGGVTDLSTKRSWTIGLSDKGQEALKTVPGLYENYVKEIGTPIKSQSFFFREKVFHVPEQAIPKKLKALGVKLPRNYVVDRNAIVSACSKFLLETHGNKLNLAVHWQTKVLYVDGEHKRVLVRGSSQGSNRELNTLGEAYIAYDYIIGCDGVRSTVRNAMLKEHRDLLFDISDTFSLFKSVNVERPKEISPNSLFIAIESLNNFVTIGCPQPGGMMNLMIGHFKSNPIAEELESKDKKVVEEYLRENLQGFTLSDYGDLATQWVQQDWSTTSQLHCSAYHSEKISSIIMGDAAHATSPALSLGMNTALCDATTLIRLLDTHHDDWDKALPTFSEERVKEGHALTELSFHLYALSSSLQLKLFVRDGIRDFFWRKFPLSVKPSATTQCMLGYELSDVYRFASQTGRIKKSRKSNLKIQRKHFDRSVGLA